MKTGTKSFLCMLAMAASLTTGCRSTSWKMPGASWLSGNREPDAATLAGTEEIPELPVSPATKYSPSNVASAGAPNRGTSPGAGNSIYGYTAQTVATPKAGLAASANGYQTGPYQVGSTSPANTSSPYGGLPNPYGGTYAGPSGPTQTPDVSVPSNSPPSSASGLAGSSFTPPGAYPGVQGGYPNSQSPSAAGLAQGSTPSYPSAAAGAVPPVAVNNGLPDYPSLPTSPLNSSAYQGNTTLGTGPTATGSAGGTSLSSGTTAGASPAIAPTGGYAPGTTGRNTTYNFGTSAPSIASPPSAMGTNPVLR